MKEMDAGTLLRFTGTCKTLMKLGDDHPEFFRRFISKKHDKKFAMSVPRKDLRNETLALVKLDPNDPLVCRIAKEKEEEKRAKEEAMKGKMKTKVGLRYVANPHFIPQSERRPSWYHYYTSKKEDRQVYVNGVPTVMKIRVDPYLERTNFVYTSFF